MVTRPNLQPEAVSPLVLIFGRAPRFFGPTKRRKNVASPHFQIAIREGVCHVN
jgi:hypothetical protein